MHTMTYDEVLGTLRTECRCDGCWRVREAVRIALTTRGDELLEQLRRAVSNRPLEDRPCSTTSPDAPGAPFEPSSDPNLVLFADPLSRVPPPAMLRASPSGPSAPASPSAVPLITAAGVMNEIDAALAELDLLGGDAPHRAFGLVWWMKSNFWLVARGAAETAYRAAWNQATDGRPIEQGHFERFIPSMLRGRVPASWEPKL